MSSREIAELTGKQHHHVMRDIRPMLEELGDEQNPFLDFDNSGANGRRVEFFNLDKDHTECLLTGYSAKARMRVIKRWHELEELTNPNTPQTFSEALRLAVDQARQLELGTNLYLGQYSSSGRDYDEYKLPKRETLLLVSEYMIHLRAKIIDRLDELSLDVLNFQDIYLVTQIEARKTS